MSVILERDRQERWRERQEQGGDKRKYSGSWLVTTWKNYLSLDQISVANRLAMLQALVEGCRITGVKVDSGGNKAEIAMGIHLDATTELNGYEAAARSMVGSDAAALVWAIAEVRNVEDAARQCGYPPGSNRTLKRLVQITLEALHTYREENERQANPPMRPGEIRERRA